MFKEYGELSTILYEQTKPVGRSVGCVIAYFTEKLREVDGPILEAGVGTGRFLIPLIRSGFVVDGVDRSPEMLAQCKANMEKHDVGANLYQQDLTELALPNKYGAIIMPTGSLCLLSKVRIADVLATFHHHLLIGGKLIVDILLPTDFRKGEVVSYSTPLPDGTGMLFTSTSEDIDWIAQSVKYFHRYELLRDGEIQKAEVSHFILHWYGISEFEMLLKAVGFVDICYEIGYGSNHQDSPITFMAVRR